MIPKAAQEQKKGQPHTSVVASSQGNKQPSRVSDVKISKSQLGHAEKKSKKVVPWCSSMWPAVSSGSNRAVL